MIPLICVLTVTVASGVTVPRAGMRSWISPDVTVATDTATGPFCPPRPGAPGTDAGCLCWIYLASATNNDKAMTTTSKATQYRRMNTMGPRSGVEVVTSFRSCNTHSPHNEATPGPNEDVRANPGT